MIFLLGIGIELLEPESGSGGLAIYIYIYIYIYFKKGSQKYQLKNILFWELISYSVLEINDSDHITASCFFPVDGGTAVRVSKLTVSIIRRDPSYI